MKKGKKTTKRVGRVINYFNAPFSECSLKSESKEDYALIADIIKLIASKDYMSTKRAQDVLDDASTIIPYISELKLL